MLANVVVVALNHVSPFELGVVCEVFGVDRSEEGLPVYDFAVVAGEPGRCRRTATAARRSSSSAWWAGPRRTR